VIGDELKNKLTETENNLKAKQEETDRQKKELQDQEKYKFNLFNLFMIYLKKRK